jgi:capsular polysaccharide biosynthesis protein/Mrp family chromosome partitioning ATPase
MTTSWIKPQAETPAFSRYLSLVRTRLWLVGLTMLVALGATAGYLVRSEKVYEASVDILVSSVEQDSPLVQLGLPSESGADPTRDVSTISRIIPTSAVAELVRKDLGLASTRRELIENVSAEPIAQSNLVNITVRAGTPESARRLANAWGKAAIADRTKRMHQAIDDAIPALRAQVNRLSPSERLGSASLSTLRQFEQLRARPDPTLRIEVPADLPSEPVSPRPVLSVAVALIGGLVLGLGGVFAVQLLDPRLRRMDQLSDRFLLPVLASIPKERSPRTGPPLLRAQLSERGRDAYNQLRAALTSRLRPDGVDSGRTVLITGPSHGDGKTTAALNIAASLADARQDVILLDADYRRAAIGRALHLDSMSDLHAEMQRELTLEHALVQVSGSTDGTTLRVLPAMQGSVAAEVALSSPDGDTLLERATRLSDWIVIDAPPLQHTPELVRLARSVDDVLLLVHLGRSNLRQLDELAELLMQYDITPAGLVVIGVSSSYH